MEFSRGKNLKRRLASFGKPKFRSTLMEVSNPKFILDVGVANDSYFECKLVYPEAAYHGLDKFAVNFEMQAPDRFVFCDLETADPLDFLDPIYDLIILNHVIEHLTNGEEIFSKLCGLLQANGVLYAEFPSIRTAYRRKTGSNYHFHEDPTHVSFYVLESLANIAIRRGCRIISCGPSESPPLKKIVALPRACFNFMRGHGFSRFLPAETRKIDHIMVKKV